MVPKGSNEMDSSDREIVNRRIINAPREVVFNAWTDPALLAQWWGPKGFKNTFHEFDPRPGGRWRFMMHGPDGTDYENESEFVEIVKPSIVVFDHLRPMHKFRVTATFEEQDDKTTLTFRMCFDSVAECDRVKEFVHEANEQNLDRLGAVLAARP
jgi:uncharacterized protein YndB with AHSA1/START domain